MNRDPVHADNNIRVRRQEISNRQTFGTHNFRQNIDLLRIVIEEFKIAIVVFLIFWLVCLSILFDLPTSAISYKFHHLIYEHIEMLGIGLVGKTNISYNSGLAVSDFEFAGIVFSTHHTNIFESITLMFKVFCVRIFHLLALRTCGIFSALKNS